MHILQTQAFFRLGIGINHLDVPQVAGTSTARNEAAHNHVLLEAHELVFLALDSCIGKSLCSLLEGCGS